MIALALFVSAAFADAHEVAVNPTAAVVFADRARVTRSTAVTVGSGRQEIVFTGLPASLITDGITADVRGSAVLRGIDLQHISATQVADERVKAIEAEIETLRTQRQASSDDATARQAEIATLSAARTQSASQLSAQMLVGTKAPQQATALRTTLSTEETAARTAWRTADAKTRDIDEKIASLERERSTLGSSATDTWTAVVHLDADKAGRVDIDLQYLVSGASWQPRYDVRGDADAGKVELALSAMVEQTTGEDWKDVKLTVSSARPGLGTIVPVLDPFWLARPVYYPPPSPGMARGGASMAPSRSMEKEDSMAAPSAPPPPPEPMAVAHAQVDTQLAATTFVVQRPEDIPADGTERKVLLTTETMDANLRNIVVPRLDTRAYLVADVTNTADFPLLAGTAGIFLTGAYLGDLELPTVAPGEKFDVAFGVDDKVTVKRVSKLLKTDTSGPIGKRQVAKWDWEVRVKNGHKRPIDVIVREQLPISQRADVKVVAHPSTPAAVPKDDGIVEFPLTVAPGADGVVTWGYEVEYPSDLQLGWME